MTGSWAAQIAEIFHYETIYHFCGTAVTETVWQDHQISQTYELNNERVEVSVCMNVSAVHVSCV